MKFPIKKFLSYYKPYRKLFISVLTGALVVAAISLVLPMCTRYIAKDVLAGGISGVPARIWRTGALMLALVLVRAVCSYYFDYKGHAMGAMMENDLRRELFGQYQRLSFRFFDGQKTGQLMSRITNDLLNLAELYHHGPEDYLIYLIKFVGTFAILCTIDARLTLAAFAFLPFMAAFSLYFGKKMKAAFSESRRRIADVNAQAEDTLNGIRAVQSFANEAEETRKFARENDRFLQSRKTIYRNESILFQGVAVITDLITVAVVVFGGIAISHATLDLADLIAFLLYAGYLAEPIQKLAHVTEQFLEGVAGFERFMEIMNIEPDIRDAEGAAEPGRVRGDIEFDNVSFRYGESSDYVLKGLSLKIPAGEFVALVGTSGVGKTTLCSLIPRFYDALEGSVRLDGADVRSIRLASLRKNVGVVQQDGYLFAGTVLENILYGRPGASFAEVEEAAKKAGAHAFITQLPQGYHTDIGPRGVRLSGGQKQRLAIARVFLKDPPVLIFDEATSALDSESERVVQDSLEELSAGRTALVIAHRLSTVRRAKRIVVLTDRGVGEEGTHEELMALGGVYARLYGIQFD